HVCQGEGNCVLATVAMLGGVSYETVAGNYHKKLVSDGKLKELLKQYSGQKWLRIPLLTLPRRLDRIPFPEWPVVVIVYQPLVWSSRHCIIVKGQAVHDPNDPQAVRMEQYAKGHWCVDLILQAVSAG